MSFSKQLLIFICALMTSFLSAQDTVGDDDIEQGIEQEIADLLKVASQKKTVPEESLKAIEQGLELLAKHPNKEKELLFYYHRAVVYIATGKYHQALDEGTKSLAIATELGDENMQTYGLNAVGQAHYNLNEFDNATEYFEKEIEIYRRLEDYVSLSSPLSSLGNIHQMQSRFDKAINYYLEAVRIQEESGKPNCLIYANIGALFNNLQQLDQELEYSRKGLECALKTKDKLLIIRSNVGLISALAYHDSFDEAFTLAQETESLLSGTEYQRERLFLYNAWGNLHLRKKEYQPAIEKLLLAYQIGEQTENGFYRLHAAHLLSIAYIETQELKKAEKYGLDSLNLSKSAGMKPAIRESLNALSRIYSRQGKYQRAYETLEQYFQLNLELVEQETSRDIKQRGQEMNELETKYEVERKEKAISLLEKENALQQLETESQKNQRYLWTIALLLLSFVLFVFYFLQRQHKKLATQEASIMEQSLKKKNELIANISHEFRTPITLITGPLQRLLQTDNKADRKVYTGIMNNAQRLLRMVDQILDLAKLEQAPKTRVEYVNLVEMVEHILLNMESLFEQHQLKVTLKKEIPVEASIVCLSADTAEKIVINLLTNAVKYTPKEGSITVSCEQSSDNDVIFSVIDSGVGISPEDQPKVFDRFVRLDPTKQGVKQDSVPGAGIGLAMVKELVEHNGGHLSLESKPGEGSQFTVIFPSVEHSKGEFEQSTDFSKTYVRQEIDILRANTNQSDDLELVDEQKLAEGLKLANKEKLAEGSAINANRQQILIVEDNPEMQRFIGECFSQYECHFADNGVEGIQKALEIIPDLVVTDLMMPMKNGYQLAENLRNDHRTCHIPIIMLTAKADDTSRMQAWRSDIDEFLNKPFSPEELQLRTHNLLSIRRLMSIRLSQYDLAPNEENLASNDQPTTVSSRLIGLAEKDRQFIETIDQYLSEHYQDSNIQLNQIYSASHMSERQFRRKIKALTQHNLTDYLKVFRLKKGAEYLQQGEQVTEVAYKVGFSSASYFSQCFKAHFGLSPSDYQSQ